MEIVDDRDGKGSLLITSQVPTSRWHEIIGDPTLGNAILDRIIHRSHRIELKGESLRKRQVLNVAESLTSAKEKWRPVQPSVVAVQRHVMLSAVPSSGIVNSMIRITGIDDRDQMECMIGIKRIQ